MSTSISGSLDLLTIRDGESVGADNFCLLPHLGNDSLLVRYLREEGQPLPKVVSWETAGSLYYPVESDSSARETRPYYSRDKARATVESGFARWVDFQGGSGLSQISVSETETDFLSFELASALSLTLPALEQLHQRYRIDNQDDLGAVVTLAPGDPLPENVVGFAGHSDEGQAQLYVAEESGPESFWLRRVITLMHTAEKLLEVEDEPFKPEVRFNYWFS